MRKNLTLTTGTVLAILIVTWSYASIQADTAAIAEALSMPAGVDVMQLTREAAPMSAEQFAAF